jgi:hypothetical protein
MPSGCLPSLSDGDQVTVVGIPTMDGILNAETVEATQ